MSSTRSPSQKGPATSASASRSGSGTPRRFSDGDAPARPQGGRVPRPPRADASPSPHQAKAGPDNTRASAVIVSHGQPSDPAPAEAALAAFSTGVARALPGWHVGSATLASPGALDAALAAAGPAPLIYPLFMTRGWFTGEALLKRLRDRHAQVLAPFGQDPGLAAMAATLVREVIAARGWQAGETRLFVAAHGSGRSPAPARDTGAFCDALAGQIGLAEIRAGFVEEPPYLADQAFDLGATSICLPYFAAKGGHVTDDVPEALELARFEGVLLDPIGCAPGAPGLAAAALRRAAGAALSA